ncbi:exported hypothetical protein [Candidatus Sulfopaludibacter sp. SbA3]|nr:exported hypothetical protein [Candidatus Sulfopaludibacter sp. SbA3]
MSNERCAFFLAAALVASCPAQTGPRACSPSPELDRFYREQVRNVRQGTENALRKLAEDPENLFLNRWYLESLDTRDPGGAAEAYRRKLYQHPTDARYLYFYGRALMGAHTTQAVEYLQRAIAADPDLPWTHWALMEIYGSQPFRDPARLAADTLDFTRLCPDDFAAFNRLDLIENPDMLRELAARFRSALERRNTSGVPAYYPRLWAAESRVAGPGQADAVRRRVAADLPRLIQLNPENYKTQLDAYKRLGDTAQAEAMQKKLDEVPPRLNVYQTVSAWIHSHTYPSHNAPPEARARWEEEELAASAGWVRDWPDEPYAWAFRFSIVARQDQTTAEEIESLGDHVVEVARAHPSPWSQSPEFLTVAQEWSRRGIRLADCTTLAADAVELILRVPDRQNELYSNDSTQRYTTATTISGLFRAYEIEASSALRRKDYSKTKDVISQMKAWIDRHPTGNPLPFSSYSLAQARVADAQGHTMDALAFYQRAIHAGNLDRDIMSRVRTLWEGQGGSTAALEAWPVRAPDPAASSSWNAPATEWIAADRSLEALHAEDLAGRLWTAADLQGKTTFINVWATWCGPCVDELPYVEKLFALLQDRKDIQLVSLNIDDDPATAAKFLRERNFTFPAIPARQLVHALLPQVSVPRNWIADPAAHVRVESIGFDFRIVDWPHDMLEKLKQPLR